MNEAFKVADQHKTREKLLVVFCEVMGRTNPNKDCDNMNEFDIPYDVVVL